MEIPFADHSEINHTCRWACWYPESIGGLGERVASYSCEPSQQALLLTRDSGRGGNIDTTKYGLRESLLAIAESIKYVPGALQGQHSPMHTPRQWKGKLLCRFCSYPVVGEGVCERHKKGPSPTL